MVRCARSQAPPAEGARGVRGGAGIVGHHSLESWLWAEPLLPCTGDAAAASLWPFSGCRGCTSRWDSVEGLNAGA